MDQIVDIGLYTGYALVAICFVLAVVMPLLNAIGNPKTLIKPVAGLALLLVVILIGWAMGDATAMGEADASTSKWVGGFLFAMYILTFIAVIGIIYTEVSKVFK